MTKSATFPKQHQCSIKPNAIALKTEVSFPRSICVSDSLWNVVECELRWVNRYIGGFRRKKPGATSRILSSEQTTNSNAQNTVMFDAVTWVWCAHRTWDLTQPKDTENMKAKKRSQSTWDVTRRIRRSASSTLARHPFANAKNEIFVIVMTPDELVQHVRRPLMRIAYLNAQTCTIIDRSWV